MSEVYGLGSKGWSGQPSQRGVGPQWFFPASTINAWNSLQCCSSDSGGSAAKALAANCCMLV
jgi:hypothetical protein